MDNNLNELISQLMKVNDYSNHSTQAVLSHLGSLIDASFDLKKIEGIDLALRLIANYDLSKMSTEEKSIYYYFAANAWGGKRDILKHNDHAEPNWDLWHECYEKQIFYLRASIYEPAFSQLDNLFKCNVYTNLANVFDTVGRFIEAIEYWDQALVVDSDFGMALGNKGIGLDNYRSLLYDSGHQGLFVLEARKYLLSAVISLRNQEQDYGYAIESFKKHLAYDNYILDNNKHLYDWNLHEYSLGKSNLEKNYRLWCLRKRLFLNPLNDILVHSISAHDVITTPDMITPLDIGPRYQGYFNQMKQEFVSARYLIFEGIAAEKVHFSDRDVLLYNTLDYPCYNLAIEKIKAGYNIVYSIFDKIAYFLNEYLNLGIKQNQVYFKKIWYKNIEKKELRYDLTAKHNLPLRGLYWLSKDLYDDSPGFSDLVEPEAKNLYEIRNQIEHKYLKIHDILISVPSDTKSKFLVDDLAYSIEKTDFEEKSIKLLKLIRNSLIYLSLTINVEELTNQKTRNPDKLAMPIFPDIWKDEWKK